MTIAELALRFVVGGTLITTIPLFAKTKYPILSGIFVLFPAVTLIGYYFIGQSMSVPELQQTTKLSIFSLLATFTFMFVFYIAQERQCLTNALLSATVAWSIVAGIILLIKN